MPSRRVLGSAWRFYLTHWRATVAVAAVAYAVVAVLAVVLLAELGPAGIVPVAYLAVASVLWLEAPLTRMVEDVRRDGRPAGLRQTYDAVVPQLGRVTGASALAALGIAAGYVLLVVPALILLVRWSLLTPVIVAEDAGLFGAFARSRDLVRGRGWRVFGGVLLTGVALLLVFVAVSAAIGLAVERGLPAPAAIPLAVAMLAVLTPPVALAWTMAYFSLAERRRPAAAKPLPHVARALDDAWRRYKRQPVRLLALAAPLAATAVLAGLAVSTALGTTVAWMVPAAAIVTYLIASGVLAAGPDGEADRSRRPWADGARARLSRRLGTLLVLAVAAAVALTFAVGYLLLVPGFLSAAAAVRESRGPGRAFRRSAGLVRRHPVAALKLLGLSVLMAGAGALGVVSVLPLAGGDVFAVGLSIAVVALTTPYVALAWLMGYEQLTSLERSAATPPGPPEQPAVLDRARPSA